MSTHAGPTPINGRIHLTRAERYEHGDCGGADTPDAEPMDIGWAGVIDDGGVVIEFGRWRASQDDAYGTYLEFDLDLGRREALGCAPRRSR